MAEEEEEGGIRAKIASICKEIYSIFVKGSPPEPCEEVSDLFVSLHVPKRQQLMMYQVFHELRQGLEDDVVKTVAEVDRECVFELVMERKRWVEDLFSALLTLGGCDDDVVTWDAFLYILLQFCSLSKVELCQALFLMILQHQKSRIHHYITMQQLIDFYSFYAKCPVTSFNTRAIDFTRLPLRRYYVEDFCQLVQRFTVLLNPTIHLQRSIQEFMPSIDFWDFHHRSEVGIRKITYDFFLIEKTRCFLWGEPPFRESCDMLAPEALGFEACNKAQWDLRTFDMHERVGAISDAGSFSKCGKFTAPPGYQYRSLRQISVWGEQPSPEETERMMFVEQEDVHISASGYITRDVIKEDKDKHEQQTSKEKQAALANQDLINPVSDPAGACLRGACLDESFNPPPVDMPPTWMKRAAIAPAPRRLGPDPPLRKQKGQEVSIFQSTTVSGDLNQSWGLATKFGKQRMEEPDSPRYASKARAKLRIGAADEDEPPSP